MKRLLRNMCVTILANVEMITYKLDLALNVIDANIALEDQSERRARLNVDANLDLIEAQWRALLDNKNENKWGKL